MPKEKSNTKKIPAKKNSFTASAASSTKKTVKKVPVKKPVSQKNTTTKKESISKTSVKKLSTEQTRKKEEFISKVALAAIQQERTLPSSPKKVTKKIPVWVWIFFGASLLLFCISLYQALLFPQLTTSNQSSLTPTQNMGTNEGILSSNQEETIFPLFENEEDTTAWTENDSLTLLGSVESTVTDEDYQNIALIQNFYSLVSAKDIEGLRNLFDTPMKNSSNIRSIFSNYKISPFIDNIRGNKIQPTNISLIDTSDSGTKEYEYMLTYTLETSDQTQEFDELWKIKIRTENGEQKIGSIWCESYRCSYNPFFWPEAYGLIN